MNNAQNVHLGNASRQTNENERNENETKTKNRQRTTTPTEQTQKTNQEQRNKNQNETANKRKKPKNKKPQQIAKAENGKVRNRQARRQTRPAQSISVFGCPQAKTFHPQVENW